MTDLNHVLPPGISPFGIPVQSNVAPRRLFLLPEDANAARAAAALATVSPNHSSPLRFRLPYSLTVTAA
jgi:hypothetical protein